MLNCRRVLEKKRLSRGQKIKNKNEEKKKNNELKTNLYLLKAILLISLHFGLILLHDDFKRSMSDIFKGISISGFVGSTLPTEQLPITEYKFY